MKSLSKLATVLACVLAVSGAQSQTSLSGTVGVRLTLQSGCSILSGGGAILTSDFGTLDFGTQPTNFQGALNASLQSTGGATQVLCSPDISNISITVGAGQNAGQGTGIATGTRAMKESVSSNYVPYEVYSDAARTSVYTAGAAKAHTISPAGQAFNLPIYGLVNKTNTTTLAPGVYSDTLTVTVAW